MILLQSGDLLEVRLKSLLADYDRDTVVNLYQPLVGFTAISLYFTLWSEASNQKLTNICTHEQLFLRMQISVGDFIKARKALEAIGLIKTYMEKGEGCNSYRYEIYSPKTPAEYFDDLLLFGLLIKYLGEADANRLKNIYQNDKSSNEGENISSSFGEVFHPDFEDASYIKAFDSDKNQTKARRRSKLDTEFSVEIFFEELKKISQLTESSFSKPEIKIITKLAALYGVNESSVAYHVANKYDQHQPKGHRLDAHDLANELLNEVSFKFLNHKKKAKENGTVSSNSDIANKINLLETVSPKDYLSITQNGTQPAPADLWLIFDLATKYQLSNGVINVVLDYVLAVKNNVLSRSFSEKIAASLAREKISTVVDAMNYINDNINTNNSKQNNKINKNEFTNDEETPMENDENKWNELLEDEEDN